MRRCIFGWAVLTVLMSAATPAFAAIVQNGSFEAVQIGSPFVTSIAADIPDWTHTGSTGDGLLWAKGYADGFGSVTVAGDGNQFVTMGGGFGPFGIGHWDQILTGLTSGQSYALKFDMASEADFSGVQSITVDFPTGSSTGPQSFSSTLPPSVNYWRTWEEKSMTFLATSTSVDLRFTAATVFDVGLDNVRVDPATATPVPSTLVMSSILFGMLGMVWSYRRRQQLASAA